MKVFSRGVGLAMGILALCLANSASAQENLDSGKSPAQLFASDCAICHKSPQGLGRAGGIFGLDNFLREHYTASRESASAISRYLQEVANAPAAPKRKPVKRTAKGDDKAKSGDKAGVKSGEKSGEKKPGDTKSGDAKPADAKASESKPSEAKASEPKPSEPKTTEAKPSESKPSEAKPAQSPKSD